MTLGRSPPLGIKQGLVTGILESQQADRGGKPEISAPRVSGRGDPLSARSLADWRRNHGSGTVPAGDDTRRRNHDILGRLLRAQHSRGGGGSRGRRRQSGLFAEDEIAELEARYPEGVTAADVVQLFSDRGIRLSEATFRKYVQKGILPRSRRVGRKGKHRGSLGVYPAKTIGRINAVKRLMGEGFTIEQIHEGYLRYTPMIESLEEQVDHLFARFDEDMSSPRLDTKARRHVKKEIAEARKTADDLLRRVGELSERLSGVEAPDLGPAGAAGSAEDLL